MNKKVFATRLTFAFFMLVGLVVFMPKQAHAAIPKSLDIGLLVQAVNTDRIANKLPALHHDDVLDQAAALKAKDMIAFKYFSHTSPEGVNPWHWFDLAGYDYLYAGENLALDYDSATDVEQAWMNSPKHRENIMNANYEDVGYAIAEGTFTDINGQLQERKGIIIVQLFGRRDKTVAGFTKPALLSPVGNLQISSAPGITGASVLTFPAWQSFLTTSLVVSNSRPKYWEAYSNTKVLAAAQPADSSGVDPGVPLIALGLSLVLLTHHINRKFI